MAATISIYGAGVRPLLPHGIPIGTDVSSAAPGTNTACTISMTADGGVTAGVSVHNHYVSAVVWSYSAAPTGGRITIVDNANSTVFDIDITAAGKQDVYFNPPLCLAAGSTTAKIILAAGGAVTGKLYATVYKMD